MTSELAYFAVQRADLTQEMMEKCVGCTNPYHARMSADKSRIILKFKCEEIPADLFRLYYTPMSIEEAQLYFAAEDNGFEGVASV